MRIIAGTYRGKKLISPTSSATRPTSDRARESLFNMLDHYLRRQDKKWGDMVFADVFAGTGAVGVEAVSRGTKRVFSLKIIKRRLKVCIITQMACRILTCLKTP